MVRAAVRMSAFVGGLVLALIVGFGVGRSAGPTTDGIRRGTATGGGVASDGHSHGSGSSTTIADQVGGLWISSGGYTLVPESAVAGAELRFRIDGPDRKPVTSFAVVHDRPMHLIVVRRDLSGYRHLHPTMAPDGSWSVDVPPLAPGVYRAYADFAAIGAGGAQTARTLGTDLTVAGTYQPRALPEPGREATVAGLTVTYEGTPRVSTNLPLLFRVFVDAAPATNLEPYLGAYGHLVALREGDLAYVHVHPEAQLIGGAVKFWLTAPSQGRYRLFFEFQLAGTVHTAEYTLVV